jgi:DNA invertase Pin-like site-specific DNA recombinase
MRVTIDHFRKEAKKRKRGRRRGASEYPAELREFAVAFAHEAIVAGGSRLAAARDLGVSEATLAKWMDDGDGRADPVFREVVVAPVAPTAS